MLKVSVVGIGNAGSQVAALAQEKLGIEVLAINSSEKDLETIPQSVPHILIGDTKGAGKERGAAKKFLKDVQEANPYIIKILREIISKK